MSVKVDDNKEEPAVSLKQQCVKCFQGTNCIKTIVIVLCVLLVVQQISSCIEKLIDKPITTYTHFDYNKTITYPSVTFCREPPYKPDVLVKYGLYAHPRYTSTWRNFNFSRIPLDQLWEEITYNQDDFFVQYALDNLEENLKITPVMGFLGGRCYSVSPRVWNRKVKTGREFGYSMTLHHYASDLEDPATIVHPGYHVYIHYWREPYTEVEVYNGGLVDYLYMNTGEMVSVKLKVDEYVMISSEDEPCSTAHNYSANACTSQYVSDVVSEMVGCSGPWMKSDLPYCDNYDDMKDLITHYMSLYQHHECPSCPRFCHSLLYNAFVTDRQKNYTWQDQDGHRPVSNTDASLETTIFLHFNNMMVSVYEEKYNYDWNLFVSDLGGSVGFLLGLSVVGLFNIIGYIWIYFIRPFICSKNSKVTVDNSNSNSDSVATVSQSEYYKKYDQKK
ncbi:degenerin-like protein asic-1 [Bicyclus anynana]|uniref:Degenerin-like protein asic-1 n=1 Tax=Bicyclus anynana TaxID=110368 RepID=A0A6J1P8I5_BICAN|nr:degenerin-like protein asic-1 [Bicyclus anynana]